MTPVFDPEGRWFTLPRGPANAITDVAGVTVGHATLTEGGARTGVTAVLPQQGNLYRQPVVAGMAMLNGFGKSAGLMQLEELGEIETPVLLTNTMSVPACSEALIRRAVAANPGIGRGAPSVNPLVLECNDGVLNDMQAMAVTGADVGAAIDAAGVEVAQGTVGAGTGMRTFGMAGGIGTASRLVRAGKAGFTLGALVQSNFGTRSELRVLGRRIEAPRAEGGADKGSVIVVMATDAPLSSRQLCRLARRAAPGLGRLGSFMGHGSGDVAIAFSTANRLGTAPGPVEQIARLAETALDPLFLAAVEAVEEAVLHAMWFATARPGHDGTVLPTLREVLGG